MLGRTKKNTNSNRSNKKIRRKLEHMKRNTFKYPTRAKSNNMGTNETELFYQRLNPNYHKYQYQTQKKNGPRRIPMKLVVNSSLSKKRNKMGRPFNTRPEFVRRLFPKNNKKKKSKTPKAKPKANTWRYNNL